MQSTSLSPKIAPTGRNFAKKNRARVILSLSCWALLIILLALFSYFRLTQFTQEVAIAQARGYFQKDKTIRQWSASHGGVYVPVTQETPPSPYLSHIPSRDITKLDGTPLTLMNPAYMIRQIYKSQAEHYGILSHITSLKLLRPENKPDEWERKALGEFEKGTLEIFEFTDINNNPYLKYMQPLKIQESCLKCHSHQGYALGDVRGGISISIPLATLLQKQRTSFTQQLMLLGCLWVFGTLFILFQEKRILKSQEASDIAKNQLASALSEHDAITATVSDTMYMFDQQGNFKWWNKSLEIVTGLSAEEVQARNALDFFVEEDKEKVLEAIQETFTLGPRAVEARLITTPGPQYYLFSGTRLDVDGQAYLVGSGHSLTIQKQVEQELIEARNTAESANQAKSVFLSSMSHELRTPLNAILGYTQIFAGDSNLTPQQLSGIKTMYQSGQHLLMLINDILDLSKIEAEKMELSFTELRLPEFLQEITDIIRVRSDEKGLTFRYEQEANLPTIIEADELRLRQIILNLLSNAVKFTDSGHCTLGVQSQTINENTTSLTISIEDCGPGIPLEMQEIIFAPFQQTGERLKYAEGSGLGLAISRKLLQLMGGELQLISPISDKESGSRFFFSIDVTVLDNTPHPMTAKQMITTTDSSQKAIVAPSENILKNFRNLLQGGDIEAIKTQAMELAKLNSGQYQLFADTLNKLARDLNLTQLETFINQFLKNNK